MIAVLLVLAVEAARRFLPHPEAWRGEYYRLWALFMGYAIAAGLAISGMMAR